MAMISRVMSLALVTPLYLAPFLVSMGRWRRDPNSVASSLQFIFFINLVLGWTGVGWLLAWWLALRRRSRPEPLQTGWVGPPLDKPIWSGEAETRTPESSEPAWVPPPKTGWVDPSPFRYTCPTCQGSGRMECRSCRGRGTWWVPPTTATGSGRWEGCTACQRSGQVQCTGPGPHV